MDFWTRVREHKILQWAIAYLGGALALAHGQELVGHAFHWPDAVNRIFMIVLIAGLPITLTLAWYHGHKGLRSMSAGELTIISLLVLIGAILFTAVLRPSAEHAADTVANDSPAVTAGPAVVSEVPGGVGIASRLQRPEVQPNSVAVLPFENLSPNPNDAYFAAGIHSEVISQLMKLSNLNVISRTSVARYESTDLSIPEIAAELGVETVMESNVRYANNRVRIAVQLIDGGSDRPLWGDTYERDLEDVFGIQADIAMNIANAVGAEFSVAEQETLERVPTSSPAAYALYLEAVSKLGPQQTGGLDDANDLLDRAIAIDPEFARAYGLKANLYSLLFINTTQGTGVAPAERADLERRVREYAARATEVDPDDSGARSGLRGLNRVTWHWSAAVKSIAPEDEADVGLADVWIFSWMGNQAEAVRMGEQAAAANPYSASSHLTLGVVYAYARDHAASLRSFDRVFELAPANPLARTWRAYNQIVLGSTEEALADLKLLENLLGNERSIVFLPELAYAYSRIGRDDDARRIFDEIQELDKHFDIGAGSRAAVYLAIGDHEEALRWLEVGAEKARNHEPDQGYINLMNLRMNFLADPRLEEPRFAEVLSRIRGD